MCVQLVLPSKTSYVPDDDLPLFQCAQELAGCASGPGSAATSGSPACCWLRWSGPATTIEDFGSIFALLGSNGVGGSPAGPVPAAGHRRVRPARRPLDQLPPDLLDLSTSLNVDDSPMTGTAFNARNLLAESRLGVLATIKSDGRPQLSPVMPFFDQQAGVIYISTSQGTAKTANLRRDPRAALEVTSADGWAWATAEGTATLTGPGSDPHGPEVDALVNYYRAAAGEHPNWSEYRSVMVAGRRVLITITVEHVYGAQLR